MDQTTQDRMEAHLLRLKTLFGKSTHRNKEHTKRLEILMEYCINDNAEIVDMMNATCLVGYIKSYANTIGDMGTTVLYHLICYILIGNGELLVLFSFFFLIFCFFENTHSM